MDHVFYQCPACGHIETEEVYRGLEPMAPCPEERCHDVVVAQYQPRKMNVRSPADGRNQ